MLTHPRQQGSSYSIVDPSGKQQAGVSCACTHGGAHLLSLGHSDQSGFLEDSGERNSEVSTRVREGGQLGTLWPACPG